DNVHISGSGGRERIEGMFDGAVAACRSRVVDVVDEDGGPDGSARSPRAAGPQSQGDVVLDGLLHGHAVLTLHLLIEAGPHGGPAEEGWGLPPPANNDGVG